MGRSGPSELPAAVRILPGRRRGGRTSSARRAGPAPHRRKGSSCGRGAACRFSFWGDLEATKGWRGSSYPKPERPQRKSQFSSWHLSGESVFWAYRYESLHHIIGTVPSVTKRTLPTNARSDPKVDPAVKTTPDW